MYLMIKYWLKTVRLKLWQSLTMLKSPDLPEPPGAVLYPSSGARHGFVDPGRWNSALPVIRPSLRAQCLLRLSSRRPATRRKREMVPPEKKDASYMSKRLKNNEAAKRSREKRRIKDLLLESQLLVLSEENAHLRDQVLRLRYLSMHAKNDKPASGRDVCPVYSPAVSKPPIWGKNERDPGISPSFSWGRGFDSLPQNLSLHTAARVPYAVAGMERSAEEDTGAHRQVAFASSGRAFLPRPDALHAVPMFPYRPTTWLVPSPVVGRGSNFTLPWLSPLLASTAPYPSLPDSMQETQTHRVGLGGDVPTAFRSRFNGF